MLAKAKHGAQSHPSASTQRSHPHDYPQGGKHGVQLENTFKLEPDDTFPSAPIKKIINEILQVEYYYVWCDNRVKCEQCVMQVE